jgi:hypothetical protein
MFWSSSLHPETIKLAVHNSMSLWCSWYKADNIDVDKFNMRSRDSEIPFFCLPGSYITFAASNVEWMHIGYDFVHIGYHSNNCAVSHGDLALNTMFIVIKSCETCRLETSLPVSWSLSTSLHTCLLVISRMTRHTSTNVTDWLTEQSHS